MLNVEIMPHGILFWRSLTQWMGGMGIILLSLAVMPLLNMGNVSLFAAEVPGPKVDKLQPRISGTARILWAIYLILTAAEIVLLKFAGMGFFDAICHALTSMATGGFSTKNNSVAAFDSPAIEYIIIAFMFMAGTSFSLIYWAFTLNFKKLKHNDEFSWYVYVVVIVTVFLAFGLWHVESLPINDAFRTALFQTVSFLTTTGFTTTTGYMHWEPLLWSVFLVIMLLGGMSGSTAGGIKISRIIILVRQSKCELKRQVHPNAVIPVRYNGKNLPDTIVASVFGFLVLYILLVFLGTAILLSEGLYLDDALGAVISSISNVGPGFGAFTQNYFIMPDLSTWTLSFLMLAGRLELFTVILLLTPWFWRR
jgi:trk system potassium uptake protein TrkH